VSATVAPLELGPLGIGGRHAVIAAIGPEPLRAGPRFRPPPRLALYLDRRGGPRVGLLELYIGIVGHVLLALTYSAHDLTSYCPYYQIPEDEDKPQE
jgi:hypothetical protein